MFKNPFRDESHDEYAARTLEQAKLDLLKALENVEFYEAIVSYRRKQIARLEGTEYAKLTKIDIAGDTASNSDSNIRNPTAVSNLI